jgi:hypothetical protein
MKRLFLLLLVAIPVYGQAWSGIIAPSRAVDWSHAGLPATLPDGETPVNQYTPPNRSQCGSTLPASTAVATIISTMVSCATGTYVLIGPGTVTWNATGDLGTATEVTLRGSGPMQTTIAISGASGQLRLGAANNLPSQPITSTLTKGATSLTIAAVGSPSIKTGMVAAIKQCDTGTTGASCTGTSFDNGGDYICGGQGVCQIQPGEGYNVPPVNQAQMVYVTSVTGTGPFTVNFTPAIYDSNWNASQAPFIQWAASATLPGQISSAGVGLEDFTIDLTNATTAGTAFQIAACYACWIKGNRIIGIVPQGAQLRSANIKNELIVNNYFVPNFPAPNSEAVVPIIESLSGDGLVINNIMQGHIQWEGFGSMEGQVLEANYMRNTHTAYYEGSFNHIAGGKFNLYENNEGIRWEEDSAHGTHTLSTWFRNYVKGWDEPYVSQFQQCYGFSAGRLDNIIGGTCGNASTNPNVQLTLYITGGTTCPNGGFVYRFGCTSLSSSTSPTDGIAQSTEMLWGNCDTVNGACRFVGSEVPSALTAYSGTQTQIGTGNGSTTSFSSTIPGGALPCAVGNELVVTGSGINQSVGTDPLFNGTLQGYQIGSGSFNCTTGAVSATFTVAPGSGNPVYANTIKNLGTPSPFQNPVPLSNALPNSFAIGNSTPSFWRACTAWTTFPTNCATVSTPPWPFNGPDVTGGPYIFGRAYDNPAQIAWKNLPTDATKQTTYAIASSSWASTNGGTETLTITGLPTFLYLSGAFQISGVPGACFPTSGASYTGRTDNELLMTSSVNPTTISYNLISNPGVPCTGSFLFPDVRQFDERVFNGSGFFNPSSVNFGNQNINTTSSGQIIALTNTGAVPLVVSSVSVNSAFTLIASPIPCGATPFTLAVGASCEFQVTFSPTSTISYNGILSISDNAAGSPHTVPLTGQGTVPAINWTCPGPATCTTYAFGSVFTGSSLNSSNITLNNTGTGPLNVSLSIGGSNPTDFSVFSTTCSSTLAAGASCNVILTFTPASAASFSATLVETDSVQSLTSSVALTGTGVTPPTVTPAPAVQILLGGQ